MHYGGQLSAIVCVIETFMYAPVEIKLLQIFSGELFQESLVNNKNFVYDAERNCKPNILSVPHVFRSFCVSTQRRFREKKMKEKVQI